MPKRPRVDREEQDSPRKTRRRQIGPSAGSAAETMDIPANLPIHERLARLLSDCDVRGGTAWLTPEELRDFVNACSSTSFDSLLRSTFESLAKKYGMWELYDIHDTNHALSLFLQTQNIDYHEQQTIRFRLLKFMCRKELLENGQPCETFPLLEVSVVALTEQEKDGLTESETEQKAYKKKVDIVSTVSRETILLFREGALAYEDDNARNEDERIELVGSVARFFLCEGLLSHDQHCWTQQMIHGSTGRRSYDGKLRKLLGSCLDEVKKSTPLPHQTNLRKLFRAFFGNGYANHFLHRINAAFASPLKDDIHDLSLSDFDRDCLTEALQLLFKTMYTGSDKYLSMPRHQEPLNCPQYHLEGMMGNEPLKNVLLPRKDRVDEHTRPIFSAILRNILTRPFEPPNENDDVAMTIAGLGTCQDGLQLVKIIHRSGSKDIDLQMVHRHTREKLVLRYSLVHWTDAELYLRRICIHSTIPNHPSIVDLKGFVVPVTVQENGERECLVAQNVNGEQKILLGTILGYCNGGGTMEERVNDVRIGARAILQRGGVVGDTADYVEKVSRLLSDVSQVGFAISSVSKALFDGEEGFAFGLIDIDKFQMHGGKGVLAEIPRVYRKVSGENGVVFGRRGSDRHSVDLLGVSGNVYDPNMEMNHILAFFHDSMAQIIDALTILQQTNVPSEASITARELIRVLSLVQQRSITVPDFANELQHMPLTAAYILIHHNPAQVLEMLRVEAVPPRVEPVPEED